MAGDPSKVKSRFYPGKSAFGQTGLKAAGAAAASSTSNQARRKRSRRARWDGAAELWQPLALCRYRSGQK